MQENKSHKPLTCTKTRQEVKLVQVKKQLIFCSSCNSEIYASQSYQPKFCAQCGAPIDWKNFFWYPEEVVKILPASQEVDECLVR